MERNIFSEFILYDFIENRSKQFQKTNTKEVPQNLLVHVPSYFFFYHRGWLSYFFYCLLSLCCCILFFHDWCMIVVSVSLFLFCFLLSLVLSIRHYWYIDALACFVKLFQKSRFWSVLCRFLWKREGALISVILYEVYPPYTSQLHF